MEGNFLSTVRLAQSITLELGVLCFTGWLFLSALIAVWNWARERRKLDLDEILKSARTIMIDGKEQKVFVTSHHLTTDEIQLLREKWEALHKGSAE